MKGAATSNKSGVRQLKARMTGAQVVLRTCSSKPRHAAMSRIQANAIIDMCEDLRLSPQEALDVGLFISEIPFAGDDGDAVLQAIAPKSLQAKKPRSDMQNYMTLSTPTRTKWALLPHSFARICWTC